MVKASWMVAALAVVFTIALGLLTFNARTLIASQRTFFVCSLTVLITGYVVVLVGLIAWSNRRQQQIRSEDAVGRSEPEKAQAAHKAIGFEYRSATAPLGLPLVHVKFGNALGQGRQPAKGWIAIGDTAVGIVFAAGGVAVGGVALGGLSIGVISIAGAAFGAVSLGGWAMGLLACGGGAVAWHFAFGGLAVARDYAVGGLAIAQHANDDAARAILSGNSFLHGGKAIIQHSWWFVLLAVLPVFFAIKQSRKTHKKSPTAT
jgi:hypothetical protein